MAKASGTGRSAKPIVASFLSLLIENKEKCTQQQKKNK